MIHYFRVVISGFLLVLLFTFFNSIKVEKWVITSGCTLSVSGSTNINSFVCEVTQSAAADTINHYNYDPVKKYYPISGMIFIDVTGFNVIIL